MVLCSELTLAELVMRQLLHSQLTYKSSIWVRYHFHDQTAHQTSGLMPATLLAGANFSSTLGVEPIVLVATNGSLEVARPLPHRICKWYGERKKAIVSERLHSDLIGAYEAD